MARTPKFKPKNTAAGWCLNVPATATASGKRERHFFPSRDAAVAAAQELRSKFLEHGSNAASIKPSLAEDATLAAAVLKPWGVSLLEAARFLAAARERDNASKPLDKATAAFLASCAGLRDRTVTSYKHALDKLDTAIGSRLLTSVTPDEIVKAADLDRAGAAAANRFRSIRAFWNFAVKRGWAAPEVFAAIESPRVANDQEITVLSVEDAAHLLATAERYFPQAVATYALQLFGGIRVEEVDKLLAKHVTESGIDLPASVAKKNRRRHITPSDTLAAWLKKYPFKPCANWEEIHKATRRLAGWDVRARLLDKRKGDPLPTPEKGEWPQNVMRHTFASYAIAAGTSLEEMLFAFGHTGSPALLRSNYLGKASKKDALEFLSLRPDGQRAKQPLKVVRKPRKAS